MFDITHMKTHLGGLFVFAIIKDKEERKKRDKYSQECLRKSEEREKRPQKDRGSERKEKEEEEDKERYDMFHKYLNVIIFYLLFYFIYVLMQIFLSDKESRLQKSRESKIRERERERLEEGRDRRERQKKLIADNLMKKIVYDFLKNRKGRERNFFKRKRSLEIQKK